MDAERRLFARFQELGIAARSLNHEATPKVADSRHLAESLPGGRSKSLLLTDKNQKLVLVTALGDTRVDIKAVARAAGARGGLSFAKPEVMRAALGVEPGHLTPFALVNDEASAVACVVVEKALLTFNPVWAHPLRNDGSTAVTPEDLMRFLRVHSERVISLDLAAG